MRFGLDDFFLCVGINQDYQQDANDQHRRISEAVELHIGHITVCQKLCR